MPLLFGKPIAETILSETAQCIKEHNLRPGLAVILIGSDAGSEIYVKLKSEAAQRIGIRFFLYRFPVSGPIQDVRDLIMRLNQDESVHGIIIQLPLPKDWDVDELIALISPEKDADGFHPQVLDQFLNGRMEMIPVLPKAVNTLVQFSGCDIQGAIAVAIVNSELFGKVIARALSLIGLKVTVVRSDAIRDGLEIISTAQVIVSVCGRPGLISITDLRPDAVVVDAGITRVNGEVQGDIAGDKQNYTGWITPIPGGVGPLTIACLLERVVFMAKQRKA